MIFQCDKCPYSAPRKSQLKCHQNWIHSSNTPWKCTFSGCDFSGKTSRCLKYHKRTHETKLELRKPYSCEIDTCAYRAATKSNLSNHVRVHHSVGRRRDVQCPLCPSKFFSQAGLTGHLRCHVKEQLFKCSDCNFSTHSSSHLYHHKKTRHSEPVRLECSFADCDYSTFIARSLSRHLKIHDPDPLIRRPYLCNIQGCSFRARCANSLKSHISRRHNPSRTRDFPCPLCSNRFYFKSDVKSHINFAHTKETSYRCQKCAYVATVPGNLKLHNRRVHGQGEIYDRKFQCGLCSWRGYQRSHLRQHEAAAHTNNGTKFKCGISACNFRTNYSQSMQTHMFMHEDDPEKQFPLACSFPGCDFRRRLRGEMNKHEQQHHSSTLELKCNLCPNKKYPDSTSLYFHKWLKHKESHQCFMCNYSASQKRYLDKHVRICHNHGNPAAGKTQDGSASPKACNSSLQCAQCDFQGNNERSMVKHSMVHAVPVIVLHRIHAHVS